MSQARVWVLEIKKRKSTEQPVHTEALVSRRSRPEAPDFPLEVPPGHPAGGPPAALLPVPRDL